MRLQRIAILMLACAGLSVLAACAAEKAHKAAKAPVKAVKVVKAPTTRPATRPGVKWTPLFNGKDLKGWKARGSAIFRVDDGCLVGTQTTGKGGDLFTLAEFDNFELRVTYRVVWPANSGFWFRFDLKKNKGYQYDVLKYKKPVAFSGTLYCPGKMFITKNLEESLENRDGWNEAVVYANGDQFILWLNGKMVGKCRDKTLTSGHIGIQVHPGGGFKGMKMIVKRMEIRPLKAGDKPTLPVKK